PVQAMKHSERVLYGTQFHPEQDDLTHNDGRRLLENFFVLSGIRKRLMTKELYADRAWRRTWLSFVAFSLGGEPHYISYGEEPDVSKPDVTHGRLLCARIAPDGA